MEIKGSAPLASGRDWRSLSFKRARKFHDRGRPPPLAAQYRDCACRGQPSELTYRRGAFAIIRAPTPFNLFSPEAIPMQAWARRLVDSRAFQVIIIGLIVANAITIGLETVQSIVDSHGDELLFFNHLVLVVFIVEAVLKLTAEWPRPLRYFRDGWNSFDFSIVALSLVPVTGEFAMAARLIRLLRVFRLVSTLPELRLIVATLVRSIPGMANVILLMSIIFYVYGVMGYHLFHENDPTHWSSLGISLLTLFRVVTLEDWTDVMYKAMELHPMAWIYFLSFVVVGTFVIINLFIAVVINNLDAAKQERLEALGEAGTKDELVRELREMQTALARVEDRLRRSNISA